MSRYREISALIFLVVFGVFIGHQMVPHHHHAPEEDHSHVNHHIAEHSHGHDHSLGHHHHEDDEPANEGGDLGCILHDHSHSEETIGFMVVTFLQKSDLKLKLIACDHMGESLLLTKPQGLYVVGRLPDLPPTTIQQIEFTNANRRGPPQLV